MTVAAPPEASGRIAPSPQHTPRFEPTHCRECQTLYQAWHPDAHFCGAPCRRAFNRRRADRGNQAYNALYAWRRDRAPGGISAISAMVDGWLRDDKDRAAAQRRALGHPVRSATP